MGFVHLHVHTEFSLLDGAARIENIFDKCHSIGQNAIAITDHGNMYGVFEFFKKAVAFSDPKADPFTFVSKGGKFKVKPIIGCEVYITDDHIVKTSINGRAPKAAHLILLAKNKTGYANLVKLVSIGYKDGLYYKPRIDFGLLEQYSEGLICLSACLGGVVPQLLIGNNYEGARREALRHKELFGEDYYIEIQDHGIAEQKRILPLLIRLARELDIPIVATNDAHYISKDDSEMQRVLQCISYRTTLDERREGSEDYFPTDEFYIKSLEEMRVIFGAYDEAISNTQIIADKCSCDFFERKQLLPQYIPSDGSTPAEFLRKIAYDGLKDKLGVSQLPSNRVERLEYELGVIINLHFVEYFLIVWDFIHYSEQNGIPVGPGRGSGAGSLVAYSIGITKLDPQKYDLYFERFLNSERVSNPDFDIDFCVVKRDRVINYVIDKYNSQNVAQIVTFGTLAAKAAIKDCGRVYNIPYAQVDRITKAMPKMGFASIGQLLGLTKSKKGDTNLVCQELVELYKSDTDAKKIIDMAMRVEGLPRQTGIHAAGVVICKDDVSDHVPIMRTGDSKIATQFDMIECEELGLLKMDFLGLNTLTDISSTLELIKSTQNINIDFYKMEYDDDKVYKMISEADTHGVFQLESGGMRAFLRELRPTCLEDIIAGISLYRPGPMDYIPKYVKGKRDAKSVVYEHQLLEPILNVTYGVIVYQEQVMQIVRELGGYTLGRADIVRRLMSKKKADEMAKEKAIFLHGTEDGLIKGAIANGVPENVASKIFDEMTSFASYAFNKSHAAAYAYLTYQTAYLKVHYPKEFFASMLNNRITHIDEISNYLSYVKDKGMHVYPPSVNKSLAEFTVEGDGIRIGMGALKNVGVGFIEELVLERDRSGQFEDFEDFVFRLEGKGINKKNIESMVYAGCFDEFGYNRPTLMGSFEGIVTVANKERQATDMGQFSLFDNATVKQKYEYRLVKDDALFDKLKKEKEVAGIYLTGHPLEEYADILKKFAHNSTDFGRDNTDTDNTDNTDGSVVAESLDNKTVTLGGMLTSVIKRFTKASKEMLVGRLEDMQGSIEVMVSPNQYQSLKDSFVDNAIVTLSGKVSDKEGQCTVWVDRVVDIHGVPFEQANKVTVVGDNPKDIDKSDTRDNKRQRRAICCYISYIEDENYSIRQRIETILREYEGDDEAFFKDIDSNILYRLDIKVNVCKALESELVGVMGDKSKVATVGI